MICFAQYLADSKHLKIINRTLINYGYHLSQYLLQMLSFNVILFFLLLTTLNDLTYQEYFLAKSI